MNFPNMAMSDLLKKSLPHIISVIIILASITIYFGPQLSGKTIAGSDVISSTAWSKQVIDYKKETGVSSNWNPSMFSGMPWGLLSAGHQYNLVKYLDKPVRLFIAPAMGLVVKAALMCFVALLMLKIHPYIALFGALAFSLNVNYIILLEAGHQSKLAVIANFPLLLSGLILCYRGKWKIGAPAIAIATSIAIANNHVQMVYYLLLCFVVFSIPFLVSAIQSKQWSNFLKYAAIALGAALLGAASNYSVLMSAKEFADDTMRGKPILEAASITEAVNSSSSKKGLDWDYSMQWSNDMKDLGAIIIPRFAGGSNAEEVSATSPAGRLMRNNNATKEKDNKYKAPMYWGNLPFTSGPAYGSIVLVGVFLLGLFVLPARLKWPLFMASFLVLLLSMGKHAAWLNRTLFDYLPLFSKFRAPSSAITLLPLFLTFTGVLTLSTLITAKKKKKFIRPILFSFGALAAVTLIFALLGGSLFSFESSGDSRYGPEVSKVFVETRASLFKSDAWRSFGLVLSSFAVLFSYVKKYFRKSSVLLFLLGGLLLFDLTGVNFRHLDSDNWESKKEYDRNFNLRPADQQILQAETKGRGYYRVLDVPNLQSAVGSYYHNTIGGYHAAKLQRYQDLLDYHVYKNNQGVLNMLNAKYIINQQQQVQLNSQALGNAWFISDIDYVSTANEEIEKLSSINTSTTAVILEKEFPQAASIVKPGNDQGTIILTDYTPNKLTYQYESNGPQFVVFSEVWYANEKGLRAYIDGVETEHFRTNYVLRGLQVPAGSHEIIFEFKPVIKGAAISLIGSILTLLMLVFSLYDFAKKKKIV